MRKIFLAYFQAGSVAELRAKARTVYRQHYDNVRKAAESKSTPLLNYKLGSEWQPLCEFLERPVPDKPFPKANEYEVQIARATAVQRRRIWEALSLLVKRASPVLIAVITSAILLRT